MRCMSIYEARNYSAKQHTKTMFGEFGRPQALNGVLNALESPYSPDGPRGLPCRLIGPQALYDAFGESSAHWKSKHLSRLSKLENTVYNKMNPYMD